MSKRLHIDCQECPLPDKPESRWVILVTQGEWGCPVLSYRSRPGEPLDLGGFIAHCSRRGLEAVLERIHAKARSGRPVWFNGAAVEADEVRRLLDAHDAETD